MKKFIPTISVSLILAIALAFAKPAQAQPRVGLSINFQTFYDQLSPYGDWIDYPDYGYTWRPRLGSDFRPYSTNGYWMYTNDYDWMWNSGYDWGWAPFHYGRWFYDPYYGWLWVPGYDWSPAWVAWRGGGDYYGWAPLRPGFSINIGFGNYNPGYDYWTFAPGRYMNSRYISQYYYPYGNNVTIFNNTTIINNYYGSRESSRYDARRSGYYTNGPLRNDVERYAGRINAYRVTDSRNAGRTTVGRNQVSVYRPEVQRDNANDRRYAPKQIETYDRAAASRGDALRNSTGANDRGSDATTSGDRRRIDNNGVNNERAANGAIRSNDRNANRNNGIDRNVEDIRGQRNTEITDRNREIRNRDVSDRVERAGRNNDVGVQPGNEVPQRRNIEMRQQRDPATNDQRAADMRQQRERQINEQRSVEMRQQRDQAANDQRAADMRQQRERQINEQRSVEMRQQRDQAANDQRAADMRQQRERQINEQRSMEMRQQRERQVNEQRSVEMRQQRERPVYQPREIETRQRSAEVQSAPRSVERSAPSAPTRESRGSEMRRRG